MFWSRLVSYSYIISKIEPPQVPRDIITNYIKKSYLKKIPYLDC